jgi:hypothetical protein
MSEGAADASSEGPDEVRRLYRRLRLYSLTSIAVYVVALLVSGAVGSGEVLSSPAVAIGFLVVLVYMVFFIVTMSTARHFGEAIGLRDYRWSLRWNVISCVIPLLNFVRPWLGFGEIYRSLINSARSGRLDSSWNHGFSWLTFLLAVTALSTMTVPRSPQLDQSIIRHPLVTLIGALLFMAIPIIFLVRIRRAARRLHALYLEKPGATGDPLVSPGSTSA